MTDGGKKNPKHFTLLGVFRKRMTYSNSQTRNDANYAIRKYKVLGL